MADEYGEWLKKYLGAQIRYHLLLEPHIAENYLAFFNQDSANQLGKGSDRPAPIEGSTVSEALIRSKEDSKEKESTFGEVDAADDEIARMIASLSSCIATIEASDLLKPTS